MKNLYTFEEFVNESLKIDEGWKDSLIGLLAIASIVSGFNHLNHSAERNLERGNPVEISVRHSILSDKPMLTRDTYTIKVDASQKEYIKVDDSSKTITINTSDISNIGLKRAVRDKIKEINPDAGITRNIRNIRIN
jgi:hypothetical protein